MYSIQFNSNIYFSLTRKVLVIAVQNIEKLVNKGLNIIKTALT